MDARVSCVLAVWNGERYLRESIDSVLGQSVPPAEVIVVDDGSTDGTAAIVREYGERLRYVHQPNAGAAAARNRGIEMARHEIVAFQDADDLWHPVKLERQLARLASRPEIAVCTAHARNFWIPELKEEAERFESHALTRPVPGYSMFPVMVARRAVFDAVGPLNTSLRVGEDTDWFLRAAELGIVMEMLPDVLLHRRWHLHNTSRGPRASMADVVKASLDRRRRKTDGAPHALSLPAAAGPE